MKKAIAPFLIIGILTVFVTECIYLPGFFLIALICGLLLAGCFYIDKRLQQNKMETAALRNLGNFGSPTFDRYVERDGIVYFYDGSRMSMAIPKKALDQYLKERK